MFARTKRTTAVVALTLGAALVLSACSGAADEAAEAPAEGNNSAAVEYPITVTDMAGNEVTIESVESIGVFHNQSFGVLESWDVEPTVAARALMSENNEWKNDESILDTGNHREPDLEQLVAAAPDLIINGGRYQGHAEDIQAAAPDAAFIDMVNDELSADEYVTQSVTLLGEIFGEQDAAEALIDEFHAAADSAAEAYDPETTVMGLVTSGNEVRYSNPIDGRGASIFFDLLDLTPALDAEGSTNHQGDDISLEALAEANADFFMVLDRDAAVSDGEEPTPALDLIAGSASLANVPAVQNDAIYVMPDDYYLTEDIFAFTEVLDGLAEAFAAQ
ncbi:MAG: ABC transporter substrate-binding protein [Leucobacter sp.]